MSPKLKFKKKISLDQFNKDNKSISSQSTQKNTNKSETNKSNTITPAKIPKTNQWSSPLKILSQVSQSEKMNTSTTKSDITVNELTRKQSPKKPENDMDDIKQLTKDVMPLQIRIKLEEFRKSYKHNLIITNSSSIMNYLTSKGRIVGVNTWIKKMKTWSFFCNELIKINKNTERSKYMKLIEETENMIDDFERYTPYKVMTDDDDFLSTISEEKYHTLANQEKSEQQHWDDFCDIAKKFLEIF